MDGAPTRQNDLTAATARAVEALGRAAFYGRLVDILGLAARHDLAAMVRYSRSGPPDLILPRIEPTEAMMSYYRHFYALDPFFQHWRDGGETGVFRLRAIASGIGRSSYAREFLSRMAIHDEIAVFLPPVGEASPTLILDRASGTFTEAEVARVRALFPLLAALHRRHVDMLVSAGIESEDSPVAGTRPLRLVDRRGQAVFVSRAWETAFADPALAATLESLGERGPCSVPLPGRGTLRRSRLPVDFGAAPGGYCDEIVQEPPKGNGSGMPALPAALAGQLTDREQEVVLLTLQGWPVIEIARRLGLSRGTVKNYRLNIYRKLDITTERELFTEYMRALGG